ncbi:hypothetical protein [Cohnella boryungensis]|uniref:Uncharacterized protein n=1 Tax=Cohnella boryungensis TaxID=768479 RepID=A0ABV8S8Q2_9BACL
MGTIDRVKLSQWDALMLESLRSLGWSDDQLIERVRAGELPADESDFHFKYETLAEYAAAEPDTFEAAVKNGYQIKYNTVRGIRSWILVRFGREPGLLLEEGQEAVRVSLSAEEKALLTSVLSFGWTLREESESVFWVEPIQR